MELEPTDESVGCKHLDGTFRNGSVAAAERQSPATAPPPGVRRGPTADPKHLQLAAGDLALEAAPGAPKLQGHLGHLGHSATSATSVSVMGRTSTGGRGDVVMIKRAKSSSGVERSRRR